jgi:hypothetical protein
VWLPSARNCAAIRRGAPPIFEPVRAVGLSRLEFRTLVDDSAFNGWCSCDKLNAIEVSAIRAAIQLRIAAEVPLRVFQGKSLSPEAAVAVAEATESLALGDARPDLVIAFTSTKQSPDGVAAALASRFPGSPVVGCTTAGEILDDSHANGALVVSAIVSPTVRWAVRVVRDLGSLDEARAGEIAGGLFSDLGITRSDADPDRHFCLTFIDGLSMKEEHVVSLMADALAGVPLIGGSAADDLALKETRVFAEGRALPGIAVFVLAESKHPFTVVKHQHYETTPRSIVITKADVANRRVIEIDGYPALEAYARALGVAPAEVTADVCFMNPLTFTYGGQIYVRSIRAIEPDQSLSFYCAIEEGMVLGLGGHEEMVGALDRDLSTLAADGGRAELFIAFNCILRALETGKRQVEGEIGRAIFKAARHVIGFDTYGEQLDGVHINQTLVGVAIRGEARS